MPRPSIEPITDSTLPDFSAFLTANLNASFSAKTWESFFRKQWTPAPPNYGYLVRDAGRVVGGIGAYYADRQIHGGLARFCNITSWCVLDGYRQQSMRLALALTQQPGFHFTDFSPTKVVAASLQFLKFRALDERQFVIPNVPLKPFGARVVHESGAIRKILSGKTLRAYDDHAGFPWLRQLAVGTDDGWCHVVYKKIRYKGMAAAQILHVGSPEVFERHLDRLRGDFFLRGIATTHVECRHLRRPPRLSKVRTGFCKKMVLSTTLKDEDIDYLYSESVALDL